MNLEQATQMMQLSSRKKADCLCGEIKAAKDVASRVFEVSAASGEPYEGRPDDWAKQWLASKKFTLVAVAPYQVAVPFANRIDRQKVLLSIHASGDGEMEPIVVDVNKNGIGRTDGGYVPGIIVVDGKHRHRAQTQMGKDRILAWVGERALRALQNRQKAQKTFVIEAAAKTFYERAMKSALESTASLYCAMPGMPPVRQDAGDGGQRPSGGTQVKAQKHAKGCMCAECKKMNAMGGPAGSASLGSGSGPTLPRVNSQGSRSSGSLDEPDPSDKKVPPDPSDRKTFVDPSDRLNWNPDKPQPYAPGGRTTVGFRNPVQSSPGSGVGPGLGINYGAKNSELNRQSVKATGLAAGKPVKVERIWNKKKRKLEATAPPGWKGTVERMKEHGDIDNPFALAYHMKEQGAKPHYTTKGKLKKQYRGKQ